MKISPKHFPPISMFCQKKVAFDFSPIEPTESQARVMKKLLSALIVEGRKNIFTLSQSIQNMLGPNREKLMDAYWKDSQKESFSGAYIETQMAIPSIELFRFDPSRLMNPKTEVEEDCLRYTFASVQGNNTVVSMALLTFSMRVTATFPSFLISAPCNLICETRKSSTVRTTCFIC